MHDFSLLSGYCVECAMPRGTTKPCEPSTDDSAQGIAELRRRQRGFNMARNSDAARSRSALTAGMTEDRASIMHRVHSHRS